ncbi:PalH/RIM21-domain-containing protein [Podospora australis]|uniref:PalH/RIM21-domain-containing protein n=1 Tax=Podospora australis TaxID=1536484 RepID=A0AAN6WWL7_9PEZI|nr:PalH/RIM21-domain-containing protein [Podospora australis]
MEPRQLTVEVTTTTAAPDPTATPLVAAKARNCGGLNLPVGGILSLPGGEIVTLTAAAAFKPVCTPLNPPAIIANGGGGSVAIDPTEGMMPDDDGVGFTYSDFQDPFSASTFPQCYALAATTAVAYTLVIMLFITPRSFLDGGIVVLGRRGFTHSGSGPSIGGRPWLQKVAALTVAISLTIATAATFEAAEEQYSYGIQNAKKIQEEVLGGNELKIIRIVSNTFLWLAQAQTLIRLFPRQREKVIIKWTAFALITLDVIFQSLNSFQYTEQSGPARPGSFSDAVPALSYLFALALGVLYAAWVIYYALMKKRYAFYHPQMKNMCLVAMLSILAILVPVVFFILDICKPEFTGWGEYVRWVGAAAASVIVWEWVERIEALEREEKRDGILGREVFDGDEMFEVTNADGRVRRRRKGSDSGDSGGKEMSIEKGPRDSSATGRGNKWPSVTAMRARYRSQSRRRKTEKPNDASETQPSNHNRIRFLQPPLWPARPAPAVTPISRSDTASAASTVYAIRYHPPLTDTTSHPTPPPIPNNLAFSRSTSTSSRSSEDSDRHQGGTPAQAVQAPEPHPTSQDEGASPTNRWRAITHNLSLKRVRHGDEEHALPSPSHEGKEKSPRSGDDRKWDIRGRFEDFAATQAERLREKFRPTPDTESLPVMVIPAPPRRGAALAQLLEEEEENEDGRSDTLNRTTLRDDSSPNTLNSRSASVASTPRAPRIGQNGPTAPSTNGSSTNRRSMTTVNVAATAAVLAPRYDPADAEAVESSDGPSQVALGKQPSSDNGSAPTGHGHPGSSRDL